jgi:S-DNA-T family DNA segregation ATPase FtsK/SpoIIIE
MALSLAMHNRPRDVQLVFIDPKRRGFGVLCGLPHLLTPLVHEPQRACEVLARLVEEMEQRDWGVGTGEARSTPRIVVFIDELADLIMLGGKGVEQPLARLAQRGREAGIHLVACTQRPAASVIGGLVKSNFPVRVVGSVASAEDAKVAAGLPKTGAERLLGKGDFLVVARGEQFRVQGAYASASEIRRVVSGLSGGSSGRWNEGGRERPSVFACGGLGQRVVDVTHKWAQRLPALAGVGR